MTDLPKTSDRSDASPGESGDAPRDPDRSRAILFHGLSVASSALFYAISFGFGPLTGDVPPAFLGPLLVGVVLVAAVAAGAIPDIIARGRSSKPAVAFGGRTVPEYSTGGFVFTVAIIGLAYAESVALVGIVYQLMIGPNLYSPAIMAVAVYTYWRVHPSPERWALWETYASDRR